MSLTVDGLNALDKTPRTLTEIANGYNGLEEDFPLSFITPMRTARYFNDFMSFNDFENGFVTTVVGGASTTAIDAAIRNGALGLTVDAGGSDRAQVQLSNDGTNAIAPYDIQVGLKSSFFARVFYDNAAIDSVIGITEVNTDLSGTVTDGLFFRTTAAGLLEFVAAEGSVETTLEVQATYTEDEFIQLAWVWDGVDKVSVYVSNENSAVSSGSQSVTDGLFNLIGTVTTNIPLVSLHTTGLTLSAANNSTSTEILIDYLDIQSDRP